MSPCGLLWSYYWTQKQQRFRVAAVAIIVVHIVFDCNTQHHPPMGVSAGYVFTDAVFGCSGYSVYNEYIGPPEKCVVQLSMLPVLSDGDIGGVILSVDWGDDSDTTTYHYDSVMVNYETGQTTTDLELWNTNNSTNATSTSSSSNTGYQWRRDGQSSDIATSTLVILHKYAQPGQYWPIHRMVGLNANLSLTDTKFVQTTCDYQPYDATTTSGPRDESQCGRMRLRPRIDIGTDGSCAVMWVSSSSPSHLLSKGAILSINILAPLVLAGLVVTWVFLRKRKILSRNVPSESVQVVYSHN